MPVPTQGPQSRRKHPPKLDRHGKTTVSALSLLALIGGWNVIGHMEAAAEDATPIVKPTAAYILTPTPSPWPTIPAPSTAPLSTLPPAGNISDLIQFAGSSETVSAAFTFPVVPALAPLPAFEPLPAIPAMPAAPSNSGGARNSGGGSHRSGGS